jgi:hypothetical protein
MGLAGAGFCWATLAAIMLVARRGAPDVLEDEAPVDATVEVPAAAAGDARTAKNRAP